MMIVVAVVVVVVVVVVVQIECIVPSLIPFAVCTTITYDD